jgi:hypothetical protein
MEELMCQARVRMDRELSREERIRAVDNLIIRVSLPQI